MNNSAHTPGPWFTSLHEHLGLGEWIIGPGKCSHVGTVTTGFDRPYAEADARLIAAAPEMLDMLYTLLPYLEMAEHDECYKPGKVADVVRSVRALISKADSGADD
tara:strand:+ start:539 stop:853 length:315 start_codon:yes stop_codon:yes gene_type:complete